MPVPPAPTPRTPLLSRQAGEQDVERGEGSDEMNLPFIGGKKTEAWTKSDTRRAVSFVMAVIVGLASGSNYVYSAYAPQLAAQLDLSSTQINLIGVAGNFGMYLCGPAWGRLVDARGQQLPLFFGSITVFLGYFLVHAFYVGTFSIRSSPSEPASHLGLFFLALSMFLSGSGGAAGLSAAVNAAAKSFSDKTRASATGLVLAGFGLSAFMFSTLGHVVFPGDAGGLLLLLSFGTGIPMFIGSLVIRPVPPETSKELGGGYEPISTTGHEEEGYLEPRSRSASVELTRSRSPTARNRHHHTHSDQATAYPSNGKSPLAFYTPYDLTLSFDFWLLFIVLALLCGVGLMYINNVGTVALALTRAGQLEYDKHLVSSWQAKQVATVSIWNCSGRIIGGIFSDTCKTKFQMQRIWFLPVVAGLFIISQLSAINTTAVNHLWAVSTLLGLSYGSLFNVVPMLVLEWFGMPHFSQNYGWICVAPVIGGNIFNVVFGRVYDSNTIGRIGLPERLKALAESMTALASEGTKHDCLIGEQCYGTAFKISTLGCVIALALSIWAGIRRQRTIEA